MTNNNITSEDNLNFNSRKRAPIDGGGGGGGGTDEKPYLFIDITSPADDSTIDPSNGPLSLIGTYDFNVYSIQDITIQIGNEIPQKAAFSSDGNWRFDNVRPKSIGDVIIKATITGKNGSKITSYTSKPALTLHIVDKTIPTITVDPISVTIPLDDHGTNLELKGIISDYFGIKDFQITSTPPLKVIKSIDFTSWKATLFIPPQSLGKYTINIQCTDNNGNTNQIAPPITFEAIDNKSPIGIVLGPENDRTFPNYGSGAQIELKGTSEDANSGMAKVEWSLDGGVLTQAKTTDNWANWNDIVTVLTNGDHNIDFKFSDKSGNVFLQPVRVTVAGKYKPSGLSDLIDSRAYLDDLLSFATTHISINPTTMIPKQNFETAFYQSFVALSDPYPANNWGTEIINQVRISIEILIRYIVKFMHISIDTDVNLKKVRTNYLQDAYNIILKKIGTSYEEIRLIRSAEDDKRISLATKLGITLYATRPDQLDAIFIAPYKVTDEKLEEIFGFANITRDPSMPVVTNPKFLKWQIENLYAVWRQNDYSSLINPNTSNPNDRQDPSLTYSLPFIDPDNIDTNDFTFAISGNVAYDLWIKRRNWVAEQFSSLQKLRESKNLPIEGLTAIVNSVIVIPATLADPICMDKRGQPLDYLMCLQQQIGLGIDISPILDNLYLDMGMLSYLLRIKNLAQSGNVKNLVWDGTVTDLEWQDVYNILTQVRKRQQFVQWEKEEQIANITLTPDYFKISPNLHQSIRWRSEDQNRRIWQDILQSRIDQQQSLQEDYYTNIQSADEDVLPSFRDAIISFISNGQSISEAANRLTNILLIDMKQISFKPTTRINQAIETLQNVFFSLRTRRFDSTHAAYPWNIAGNEANFDEEWSWMGSYETWRAATLVFYYPENILLPSLLTQTTESSSAFKEWISDQRKEHNSLDPEEARNQAGLYFNSITVDKNLQDLLNKAAQLFWKSNFSLTEQNMSDDRLRALQSACRLLMTGSPIAHWTFDEGAGLSAADSSGNGNTGLLTNGPLWSSDKKIRSGMSLSFDGIDDHVKVNNSAILEVGKNGTDFSISFWIYLNQKPLSGKWRSLLHKGNIDTERTFGIWLHPNDNGVHYRISTSNTDPNKQGWNEGSDSKTQLTFNNWFHIAYVKSGLNLQLYINGRLDSSVALSAPSVHNSGPIYIGKDPWNEGVSCKLDDLRIYDRSLSQAEVSSIWSDKIQNAPYINYFKELFYFVPMQLALQLQKSGEYIAALDWYQIVYAYNLPVNKNKIYYGLEIEKNGPPSLAKSQDWLLQWLNPHTLASNRPNPYSRFTLMSIARCFIEFADLEFTRSETTSTSKARSLYMTARSLLTHSDLQLPKSTDPNSVLLPNPVLDTLVTHVENSLSKIQQGRTFGGLKRHFESYVSSSDPSSISKNTNLASQLPDINSYGEIVSIASRQLASIKPTPYKYAILIERSKQLVNIAQQIETSYLSALEKKDIENYNLMKAGFDLSLAESNKQLQDLRVNEARDNEDLAKVQKTRITEQQNAYTEWINAPMNYAELNMINSYKEARKNKIYAEESGLAAEIAKMTISALAGNVFTSLAAGAIAVVGIGQAASKTYFNKRTIDYETQAQVSSVWASYESRKQQWELQKKLLDSDLAVSDKQIIVAQDHTLIAKKESDIANMQSINNKSIVDFLANKFSNAELYDWMIGILSGVYRYFLLQSTSMALLAQSQLAFERQERSPNFIQTDYWKPPTEEGANLVSSNSNDANQAKTDRRGLTGSARLLQDIYQLDQFAFETNKRKLNLVHNFSLAQLFPLEFQQFRETGVLNFITSMSEFDKRFPGHYLRLIKRVRTSIIALVPPLQGISATLSSNGLSHVTISNGEVFKTINIVREPELVALTSPTNATGVFEMDSQSEMLLPFESLGVESTWQLQLPKAANPFDFGTISDVIITIEYTALNSMDYRQQIIRSMNNKVTGDRKFSFKEQFPDQWYQLQNPDQIENTDHQLVVNFDIASQDFPINIENVKLANVLLYIAKSETSGNNIPFEVTIRLAQDQSTSVEDEATSIDGVISTRRGSWPKLRQGKSPVGKWEMSFKANDPIKNAQIIEHFIKGDIDDILFIITYKANLPSWPL